MSTVIEFGLKVVAVYTIRLVITNHTLLGIGASLSAFVAHVSLGVELKPHHCQGRVRFALSFAGSIVTSTFLTISRCQNASLNDSPRLMRYSTCICASSTFYCGGGRRRAEPSGTSTRLQSWQTKRHLSSRTAAEAMAELVAENMAGLDEFLAV